MGTSLFWNTFPVIKLHSAAVPYFKIYFLFYSVVTNQSVIDPCFVNLRSSKEICFYNIINRVLTSSSLVLNVLCFSLHFFLSVTHFSKNGCLYKIHNSLSLCLVLVGIASIFIVYDSGFCCLLTLVFCLGLNIYF